MKRLEDTHGTLFELIRHFLARMFDSDLFASAGQGRSVAIGAFALVIPLGMLAFDKNYAARFHLLFPQPPPAAFIVDGLALSTLIFAVVGLTAILQWQSLFPGTRDFLALAGLPVRPRQIFSARIVSVLLFSLGIVAAISFLPSFVMPAQLGDRGQRGIAYLGHVLARGVSFGLGGLFLFTAIMALQGLLLNLLPGRWFTRVSVWVQGALTAALLVAALLSPSMGAWPPEDVARLPQMAWAPTVWFGGLHERLLGVTDPFCAAMAARALQALGTAVLLVALTYLLAYRRYRKLLLEAPHETGSRGRRWPLARLLASSPQQEAILSFMTGVLSRSRTHRLVLLAYLGGTAGYLINSLMLAGSGRDSLRIAAAFWPLAAIAIMLSGLRHAFAMPVELRANWVFRLAESFGRADWMAAVERFVIVYGVVTIQVALYPVSASVFGFAQATRMTVLQSLVSLTFFEILFRSWQQLPFACAYLPGKRPLISILSAYLAVLGGIVPLLSQLIVVASRKTIGFTILLVIFTTAWVWTRRTRRDGWGEAPLYYEDRDTVVPDIGISDVAFHRPVST